jgi:hypothetical protein
MKLIILFVFFIPTIGFSQNAFINGVVTYYFNEYQGNKPDLGANVYVINKLENTDFQYKLIDSFITAKTYKIIYDNRLTAYSNYNEMLNQIKGKKKLKDTYEEYQKYAAKAKQDVDDAYSKLRELGIETSAKFDTLDSRAASALIQAQHIGNPLKTVVDGIGNYSFKLKPGDFYILIVSNGRRGQNITEVMGKIYVSQVNLKENETKNVSYNFDLY